MNKLIPNLRYELYILLPLCQMDIGTAYTSLASACTHVMWSLPLTGAKQGWIDSPEEKQGTAPEKLWCKCVSRDIKLPL